MKIDFDRPRLELQIAVVFVGTALLATVYASVEEFVFQGSTPHWAPHLVAILVFSAIAAVAFLLLRNWAFRLGTASRANEERLRFLMASSPVTKYACEATPPYAATYISPNVERLMGYAAEQFTGNVDFWAGNIHPEDRERVFGSLLQVFERDERQHEYRFRWPDGSYHWILDAFRLIRDENGEPAEIIGYWADITERRQLDDQLRLQARVLDQIQDHVTITNLDGFVTYVNQSEASVKKLLEHRIGAHVTAYGDAPEADATQQEIAEATRATGAWHGKVVNFMADGAPILLDLRTSLVRDENGKPVAMVGVGTDITERKRTEDTLRLHSAMLTTILEGILLVKSDGVIVYSNPQIERQLGYAPGELVGKHVSIINAPGERGPEDVVTAMMSALLSTGSWRGDLRNKKKDGTVFWAHACISGFDHPQHGKVWLSVQEDITERKNAEAELTAAKEEAQEAHQAKSAFLARMSHELRTPLNSILGFAQVMELDADEATIGEYRDSIRVITRSGWHLLRIINDLLNLSAIEANKVALQHESFNIGIAIHASFALVSPLAIERGIALSCLDDGCDGLMALADPFRFDQVLINLLANAIKYNRDGGAVTVSCRHTPGRIRILISDTGGGIPESDLPSLFQPFSRLSERPYQIEGAGIGLSIAKQLTELMGGMIGVESVLGEGSTFWIEFPEGNGAEAISTSFNAPPPSLDDVTRGIQATLLYIEDNPDHTNLVRKIVLQMNNLTLLTAHTPGLGLDLARARRPDLILLDICLPGLNGYEVLDLLQADARTCNIPVIAISATANPAEIEKGLKAGFRHYLTKPLNVTKFSAIVAELLDDAPGSPE